MFKKIGAVSIGVIIGLVFAFARAGAFQLWGSDKPQSQSSPAAQSAQAEQSKPPANVSPAPANQPEPNEKSGVVTTFAPLVKRVMPTVVNVAVVQEIKAGSMEECRPGGRRSRRRRAGGRPRWTSGNARRRWRRSIRAVPALLRTDAARLQTTRIGIGRDRLARWLHPDQQSCGGRRR